MTHQLLSIAVYRGHIITTCPATGRVGVWTTRGEFVGAHQIKGASSIVTSFKYGGVIIGSGDDQTPMSLMTFSNGTMNVKSLNWGKGASGAHAFIL